MSICTNKSIMKKSVTSSVTVREHKWIPQRNNWKQSDSLSAQLGEMQCSPEKKGFKTKTNKKPNTKTTLKFAFFRAINPFEWRVHLSTTNWQKQWITTANVLPFKATIKTSSKLFRGRTPFTSFIFHIQHTPLSTAHHCPCFLAVAAQRSQQSTLQTRCSDYILSQDYSY